MILAQGVEQVTTSGLSDFAGKFGFPALLVLVLLFGIYKMLNAAQVEREKRDDRDEKREQDRRLEREADRKAHVDALQANTNALINVASKVDSLVSLREQELRLVKGG
jgi:hypothetical protein